jgi:hypothetical protein
MKDLSIIREGNEKDLAKRIVVPLLRNMGFTSVQYVCGTDEFGRDIIFCELDKFNNARWMGAQVKAFRIHGTSSRSKGNVQEIVNQIQEAFSNPFYDTSSNREDYVNGMYVITSKEITAKAKSSIKNRFKNQNVHFVDGQKLQELIQTYSPELLYVDQDVELIRAKILDYGKKYAKDFVGFPIPGMEIAEWYKQKTKIKLGNEEQKALCTIFANNLFLPYFRFHVPKTISWLDDLDPAIRILSRRVNSLIKRFPFYSDSGAAHSTRGLLFGLRLVKQNSKKTFKLMVEQRRIDAKKLVTQLTKALNNLEYPYRNEVFMSILEMTDILSDFSQGDKLFFNVDDRSRFLLLISLGYFEDALTMMVEKEELLAKFSEIVSYYIKEATNVLGFDGFEFRYLKTIGEFVKSKGVKEVIKEEDFLRCLKPQYRTIYLISMNRLQEATEILSLEEAYEGIGEHYLPTSVERLFGNLDILLTLLEKAKNPPMNAFFLLELAEKCYRKEKYEKSLKYANEAWKRRREFYSKGHEWLIKWVKKCRARSYFKLGKYKECYKINQSLIDEKVMDIDWEEYEKSKARMKKAVPRFIT